MIKMIEKTLKKIAEVMSKVLLSQIVWLTGQIETIFIINIIIKIV